MRKKYKDEVFIIDKKDSELFDRAKEQSDDIYFLIETLEFYRVAFVIENALYQSKGINNTNKDDINKLSKELEELKKNTREVIAELNKSILTDNVLVWKDESQEVYTLRTLKDSKLLEVLDDIPRGKGFYSYTRSINIQMLINEAVQRGLYQTKVMFMATRMEKAFDAVFFSNDRLNIKLEEVVEKHFLYEHELLPSTTSKE